MARTHEAMQFVATVEAANGVVPPALTNLLQARQIVFATPPVTNPGAAILDAAVKGELTEDWARELISSAATTAAVTSYTAELAAGFEQAVMGRFHAELRNGAGDEILASLRPKFDEAAQTIRDARAIVDINTPAAQLIDTASAEEIDAWRSLRPAIDVIDRIASVAAVFGPGGSFELMGDPGMGILMGVRNEALFVVAPSCSLRDASVLIYDRRTDVFTSSPWLRLPVRLATVDEARERLNEWVQAQRQAMLSGGDD